MLDMGSAAEVGEASVGIEGDRAVLEVAYELALVLVALLLEVVEGLGLRHLPAFEGLLGLGKLLHLVLGQGEALELDKLTEAAGRVRPPATRGRRWTLNEGLQSILDTGSAALWGVVRKAVRSGILLLTVVLLCALGDGAYSGTGFGTSLEIVPIIGALAIPTAVAVTDVSSLIGMGRQALDSMDSFSKVLLPTLAAATAREVTGRGRSPGR